MTPARLDRTAILVLSVCAACALVEIGFRIRGAYAAPNDVPQAEAPDLFQSDPDIGYRLRPSMTTTYRYPVTSPDLLPLVSNADGFRSGRELDGQDDRQRVLVVGDSFIYGLGVRVEDRVSDQLEAMEPSWRVDNLGIPGWGLDLMVRAIERYAGKAKPRIVILAIYSGDLERLGPYFAGMGYAFPKFDLVGGELVTVPFPRRRFWERLRLVQLAYRTIWNRDRNRYDLNAALLNRYWRDAGTMGFTPVIVFHPSRYDNADDRQRRVFLRQWTERQGVPFLDLTAALQDAGVENVFLENNLHWNSTGHRIAAAELRTFIHGLAGIGDSK